MLNCKIWRDRRKINVWASDSTRARACNGLFQRVERKAFSQREVWKKRKEMDIILNTYF